MALALDLALQGAGVGRDPHRRPIGLGPQAGRRQIGQGLADAGAGLGQHHARLALALARLEGEGGLGGVFALGRACLVQAHAAQHVGEAPLRALRRDRLGARLARRRLVLPFGDAAPGLQPRAAEALAHRPRAQGGDAGGRPGPVGAAQGLGQGQALLARGPGLLGQFGQELGAGVLQRLGLLGRRLGFGHAQGLGQADGGRRAEPRRSHEGVELEPIVEVARAGRGRQAQPPRRQARMGEQRPAALHQVAGVRRAHRPGARAVGDGALGAGQDDQGGREVQGGGNDGVHDSLGSSSTVETEPERSLCPLIRSSRPMPGSGGGEDAPQCDRAQAQQPEAQQGTAPRSATPGDIQARPRRRRSRGSGGPGRRAPGCRRYRPPDS